MLSSAALVQKLMLFYNKYNPEKLPTVAETASKFESNESTLWSILYAKYLVPVIYFSVRYLLQCLTVVVLFLLTACTDTGRRSS